MWGAERGSIFVVVPPSPLLFLFLITDVSPTLKNAWAWQVGLCRNARWHLSWNWTWLPHLADVLNPLMGSAKGVSCVSPSNGLHSEAVPTCWTEWRKGWSMQAIAVSPGEKEVHRVVLGVWQYEQLPCFMSLLIDKESCALTAHTPPSLGCLLATALQNERALPFAPPYICGTASIISL